MPADFAIGPSRKRKKPDRAGQAIRAVKRASSGPRTDAQTSGRNYGVRKADKFKQTRPYRQAVESAVRAQPAKVRLERTKQVADRAKGGKYTGHTPVEDLVVINRARRLAATYRDPKKRAARQLRALRQQTGAALEHVSNFPRLQPIANPNKVNVAGLNIDLGTVGDIVTRAAVPISNVIPPLHDALSPLATNVVKDAGVLATAPFVGGYELGASAFEGLKDRPYLALGGPAGLAAAVATTPRGQKLGKGVAEGVVNSAPGRLVRGDVGGAAEVAYEHPLITGLDFAGATAAVGRVGGAFARTAGSTAGATGVRGALARAGSTQRLPLLLGDEASQGTVARAYSKDLTRKAVQRLGDRRRETVHDAEGNPVAQRAHNRERPHLNRTQADIEASRAGSRERLDRVQASKEHRTKIRDVRGKKARDVVQLVTTGTITSAKHFEDDLRVRRRAIVTRLAEEDKKPGSRYSDSGQVKAARDHVELIDSVLNNPKAMAQAQRIVAEGERHGKALRAQDAEKQRLGVIDENVAAGGRLSEVKFAHLGGEHWTKKRHAKAEKAAAAEEKVAAERVAAAQDPKARQAALADLDAARKARVAVSGRDPAKYEAHLKAQTAANIARKRAKRLSAEIARMHKTGKASGSTDRAWDEARLKIEQSIVDGARKRIPELEKRLADPNEKYPESVRGDLSRAKKSLGVSEAAVKRHQAALKGAGAETSLAAKIAEHEKAVVAARKAEHQLRENPLPKQTEGIRDRQGRPITDKQAEEFLRSRGRDPETVGHVPHRDPRDSATRGRQSHHAAFLPGSRPTTKAQPRTGSLFQKGATETSAGLLQEAGVRNAVQIAKAEQIDKAIGDHGLRHPAWAKAQRGEKLTKAEKRAVEGGGYFTAKEADAAVRRLAGEGKNVVAVRAHGAKLSKETSRVIREDLQNPGGMDSLGQRLLNDRLEMEGGARNIVLVDGDYMNRLAAHLKPAGGAVRAMQYLNKYFRFAVLAQPRWLAGNIIEPFFVRLPTVGTGALNVYGLGNDMRIATKLLKRMEGSDDPKIRQAAQEIRAQQMNGLLIGGRENMVRRQLGEIPYVSKAYAKVVEKLPVVQHLGDLLQMIPQAYFSFNRLIEGGAQRAAFGRSARRELHEMNNQWARSILAGKEALDDLAKGLVNTDKQAKFMREQYKLLGKYNGFSPWMRNLTQTAFPFIPWMLNAARFVLWTMPAQRTVQTALLTKTAQVVEKDWQERDKNTPPGALGLAVPTSGGGLVDLARYTPFGLAQAVKDGDLGDITSQAFPQFQGPVAALNGKDPFGRDLALPGGRKPGAFERVLIAGYQLAESTIAGVSTARRLREKGATAYSNSTIFSPKTKPGTSHGMSALNRTLNPFRPTYLTSGSGTVAPDPTLDRLDRALQRRGEQFQGGGLTDEALDRLDRALARRGG